MSEEMALAIGGNDFFNKVYDEHLKERKIILNDEVSANIIEELVLQVLKFNKEDKGLPVEKRKKIYIYINSLGGCVFNGMASIDAIRNSVTPVVGITLGYGYSMGALIFLSTHERYMMPSSSLLIHDGSTTLSGSNNKVKDLQKFYAKVDAKLKDIVVSRSKITSDEYDANVDRELYLLAEECKEKGLCDGIIGQDIDLDDII